MSVRLRLLLPAGFALLVLFPPTSLRAGVGEWTSSGPEGGSVEGLASHPSHPSTVYAATSRRLYKSVDAGATWAPTGLVGGFNLVLPTSDPSVVYATTTSPSSESPIYRTRDGGASWVEIATRRGRLVSAAVDPHDPMTVYAVTTLGLFRTTDGGDSWEALPNPPGGGFEVTGIVVDPADSQVLYAAVPGGTVAGVYRSRDRGATWLRTNLRDPARALLFASGVEHSDFYDAWSTFDLLALTSNGLQVTANQGTSWRRLARSLPDVSHLAIDPANPAHLYVISGDAVLQSSDGGETVTPVGNGSPVAGLRGIVASESSVVLLGSDVGVSRSGDGGRSWRTASNGIREVFVHSVAIDPADPAVVFVAGPGMIYQSRNGGESWSEPSSQSPDAEALGFDPSDLSTLYAGGLAGVQKSADGGRTWKRSLTEQIGDLLIDPNNPRRLFAAYRGVYRSVDGSDSWRKVMTPDDNYSTYYYGGPPTVTALALAPSDSSIVYAGGDTGFVYRSDNGGENWSDLHAEVGSVNALAVDSCDPGIVHAGSWGNVYRSLDGGQTWSGSAAFPRRAEVPYVYALARDPRHSSTIFAGTSDGLAWSIDRGTTWRKFEPALEAPVRSIAIDPSGRFLYAGTESGVFVLERAFGPCGKGADRLCLLGAKYQVSVTARNPRTGASITGHAIDEGDRFGYFSFPDVTGDPTFPEVFVKMLDASNAPPPYGGSAWVFHSSLTDLAYTLTVRETESGRVRIYDSPHSASLTCGEADTSAFGRACEARAASIAPPALDSFESPSGAELSLLGGRFRATVRATDPRSGRVVDGAAFPRADGFGYFGLVGLTRDAAFPEIFVKMADGRANGGHFWVFHTGLTDLNYVLTVRDTQTGAVKTYPGGATDGTHLCGAADTSAFHN